MVAAPQKGSIQFIGASGRKYNVAAYFSDVAAGAVNLSAQGVASSSSPTYWQAPESVRCVGMQIHTGMTDTTAVYFTGTNFTPVPNTTVSYVTFLDTLQVVYNPGIVFAANAQISLIQG